MANDPYFSNVVSLLPFDTAPGSYDANWNSLLIAHDFATVATPIYPFTIASTGGTVGVGTVSGKQALTCANSSYLTFPQGAFNAAAFTLEFDFYANSFPGTSPGLFSHATTVIGSGTESFLAYITASTGAIGVQIGATGFTSASSLVTTGTWYRLAIAYNGTNTTRVYLNGSLIATVSGTPASDSAELYLRLNYTWTSNQYGNFSFANFRLWKTCLYTGSSYTPLSTFPQKGVTGNDFFPITWAQYGAPALSSSQSKFGGSSLYLNGSSSIGCPAFSFSTSDFTVEGWVYWTNTIANQWPFANWNSGGIAVESWTDGNLGMVLQGSGDATYQRYISDTLTLANNTWYHIAFVRYGNRWMVYVNGVPQLMMYCSSAMPSLPFYIGSGYDSIDFFTGYVDDFRVTVGYCRYPFTPIDSYSDNIVFQNSFRRYIGSSSMQYNYVAPPTISGAVIASHTDPWSNAGNALYCSGGSGTYISYAANAAFNPYQASGLTIEMWVFMTTLPSGSPVVLLEINSTTYELTVSGTGVISMNGISSAASAFPAGQWNHVAISIGANGATTSIYVGGTRVATGSTSWPNASSLMMLGSSVTGVTGAGAVYFLDFRMTRAVRYSGASYSIPSTYQCLLTSTATFTPPTSANATASTVVSGTVLDVNGNPAQRQLYVYSHATGALLGSAQSNPSTGAFSIAANQTCFVVCQDSGSSYNTLIFDDLTPS